MEEADKGGSAMLKAVAFDDEYIVLQGLTSMIDWGKLGPIRNAM